MKHFDFGRTPKNYDGTRNPERKLSDCLPGFLSQLEKRSGGSQERLYQYWFTLIREPMAAYTEPVSFEKGTLTILVKSSSLYHLLCQHERPHLLKQLQEKFPVRTLVFRIGS